MEGHPFLTHHVGQITASESEFGGHKWSEIGVRESVGIG